MAQISIYFMDWGQPDQLFVNQKSWLVPRKNIPIAYTTEFEGERAAEEAFHLMNAPVELLGSKALNILRNWRGRALSTGDVVGVRTPVKTQYYMCKSTGWQELAETKISNKEFEQYIQW
jgi:hypothetical protein